MTPKNKIYDFEITPPSGVWDKIAEELNEWDEVKSVSQKLQTFEISAPAMVWEKINEELDDLNDFKTVSQKLRNLEVTPPSGMWNHIQQSLDGKKEETNIIPLRSGGNRWIKYAAAACVIGLVGILIYYYNSNSGKEMVLGSAPEIAQQQTVPQISNPETIVPISPGHSEIAPGQKSGAAQLLAATPITRRDRTGNVYAPTIEKNEELQGRYIMLMTENGDVVRLSKKLSGLADCIAGEDNSLDCNQQIAQWQEQMVKTSLPSTPDNFLDLLKLAEKENGL